MATHDYVISNASGAAVRADLNNALAAIISNNSNATEPSTTYAYQWWADTGSLPAVMKLRNAANDAWIELFQLDGETGVSIPSTDVVAISTGGTERMRIASNGRATHSSTAGAGDEAFNVYGANGELRVLGNGNVQNTNNSYGVISDEKVKENVVDANSQWLDVKNIKIRNFNFKEETGYEVHRQIGVIAQEVEEVSPGLVYEITDYDKEGNDLGTVTKGVHASVLYMKAVKALQEAMERIETLEARVAALEGT